MLLEAEFALLGVMKAPEPSFAADHRLSNPRPREDRALLTQRVDHGVGARVAETAAIVGAKLRDQAM